MSRRKQAKPRAVVKRDTDDEEIVEEERVILVDDDGKEKTSTLHGSSGDDESLDDSIQSDDDVDDEENVDSLSDSAVVPPGDDVEVYRCEICCSIFTSLPEFMDHRNYICGEGDAQEDNQLMNDSLTSLSPLSTDAVKSHNDLQTAEDAAQIDADLGFSIGIDETHPYACQFCEKAFGRLSHLKKHEQVHSDLLPFKCSYCNRLFRHKRSRDRHVKLHTGDKKHKCPKCESAFARSDHLKIHLKSHDNGKPFRCTVCSRGYTNSAALTSHMLFHKKYDPTSTSKGFSCMQCRQHFTVAKELQEHYKSHRNPSPIEEVESINNEQNMIFKMEPMEEEVTKVNEENSDHSNEKIDVDDDDDDDDAYIDVSGEPAVLSRAQPISLVLNETIMNQTPQNVINDPLKDYENSQAYAELICEFCLKSGFSNKDVLDMHIQMVHAGKSKSPYLCPFCNAAYPTFYNLAEHVKILHEPLFTTRHVYQCSFCSKDFNTSDDLQHHNEKHHRTTNVTAVTCFCPTCNIAFTNQSKLAEHVQLIHKSLSPSYGLPQQSPELKRHSDHFGSPRHLKIPKFSKDQVPSTVTEDMEVLKCDECSMIFYDQHLFKEHIRSHLDISASEPTSSSMVTTPTSLPLNVISSRASTSGGSVSETMLSKNGTTIRSGYDCPECQTECMSQDDLESHVIMHYLSLTTEYGCTSCLKLFLKPDELQKHLMDIHAHHLYRCSLCKEIFDSKVNVQVHFAIKHSNECKLYKCTLCNSIFRSEMEWQLHVKVQHLHISKPYRCLFCKDSFSTEMDLQVHLTAHKKQYQCTLCSEAFHVEYQMDKHMQNKHSQDNTEHDQKQMMSKNDETNNLNVDQQKIPVQKENNLKCSVCEGIFSDEVSLLSHLSQAHNVIGLSPPGGHSSAYDAIGKRLDLSLPDKFSNACVYCNQTFKTKGELEKHMKIHATPSSLKCNICDEVFPSSNILAEHKLIHCKVVQGNACVVCKFTLKNENQFYFHAEQHGLQGTNMQCVICRQTLMSSVELNMHAKFHFQNSHSFFTCCVCLKTFNTKENLVAKLNSSGRAYYVCKPCYHGHDEEHQCTQCNKIYSSKTELDVHVTSQHGRPYVHLESPKSDISKTSPDFFRGKSKNTKSFFTCCVCLKTFDTQEHLVPKLNASGRAYYVCKPCYHGKDTFTEHSCDICRMKFVSEEQLQVHAKIHKKTYQCIKCQEAFSTEYEIQLHVATHMMQEGNIHECHICDNIFESPAKLQCHLIEHTFEGLSNFCCYVCSSLFSQACAIQSHVLEHGIKARKYSCVQCNQKFFFSAELQNHLYIHGIKIERGSDVSCPECDKTFQNVSDLNTHYKTHLEKKLKCPLCDAMYEGLLELEEHVTYCQPNISNTEKSNLICPVCHKECLSLNLLYSHLKVHSTGKENRSSSIKLPVKQYSCTLCSKSFVRKSLLKEHMSDHVKQQYACDLCCESFPQVRLLNIHVSSSHSDYLKSENNNSSKVPSADRMDSEQQAIDVTTETQKSSTQETTFVPSSEVVENLKVKTEIRLK